MENTIETIQLPPQQLQRIEKLQVYAILSGEKGEALIAVKDKLILSLVLAFNDSEAKEIASNMVKRLNRKPEEYQIPFMMTKMELEKLIPNLESSKHLVGGEVEAPPNEKIVNIKNVFKLIGTATQIKVANAVIEKYKKHVKFLPKIPQIIYEYDSDEAN